MFGADSIQLCSGCGHFERPNVAQSTRAELAKQHSLDCFADSISVAFASIMLERLPTPVGSAWVSPQFRSDLRLVQLDQVFAISHCLRLASTSSAMRAQLSLSSASP
jgi:hypothetical protein